MCLRYSSDTENVIWTSYVCSIYCTTTDFSTNVLSFGMGHFKITNLSIFLFQSLIKSLNGDLVRGAFCMPINIEGFHYLW